MANTLVAVYDDLARLRAVSMNDARGAWKAAESGRSWALDELLGQSTGSPAAAGRTSLQDVQRRLPEGTQALYFAVLPDRLLVWLIEPGRFEMTETVLDPKEISAQIGRLRNAIGSGEANWQERAAALSGRVLGRLAGQLRPGSLLLVFPDKDLHAIPFPVLRDARGRFLFATHEVSVFPNATMFARGAAKRRPSALPQALVVGPPQLDPVAFPDLRRLPGAEEETRAVAALYPGVQLVTGEGATEGAVRRGLGGSEIIQISAHAVASQRLPWRSVLPLNMASDDSSDGGLYAQEVASLDLGRTGLVILSTCDSGRGSVRAGQGPTSLASAFLAAGSSAVVAALVRVPDRSSGTVVLDLHRRLLAGDSPAAALRHAELRAWRSGAHPASWAGYEVLGHAFQPLVAGPRPPV